ncbi:hypothetical protein GGR56DRAFT_191478 [Xylariaceae sp. FL0804]|nr:hypothetical protein GGR56DRAFT_191478 [Xylariaceae sp. FL0804]
MCLARAKLQELRSFNQFRKDHNRWSKCLGRVEEFAKSLAPYFEVLNTFVSSHPEWTAVAWGAIRLILQVQRDCTAGTDRDLRQAQALLDSAVLGFIPFLWGNGQDVRTTGWE